MNYTLKHKNVAVADLLIIDGSGEYRQEPFNEVISSGIVRRLGVNHIPLTL